MVRRTLLLASLLLVLALPLAASQFIEMPFDRLARESSLIVRGNVEHTWSAWDDAHEVIFTYATIRVHRYFGEATGPDTLVVREVGGTVDGYTQEAIGFPMVRRGESVVLFLTKWDDSADFRINAFNQGKFLVQQRGGVEVLVSDPVHQGEARLAAPGPFRPQTDAVADGPAMTISEFEDMVVQARAGEAIRPMMQRQ
jgi:hypothetical protein